MSCWILLIALAAGPAAPRPPAASSHPAARQGSGVVLARVTGTRGATGLRVGQKLRGAPARLRLPAGSAAELLTVGGCLLRIAGPASLHLLRPVAVTRCPALRLLEGRVGLSAPGGTAPTAAVPAAELRVAGRRLRFRAGEAVLIHRGELRGLCLRRGAATSSEPSSPALAAGYCHWFGAQGPATTSTYAVDTQQRDRARLALAYGFHTPGAPLRLDLESSIGKLSKRGHQASSRGSEVEGGGQSMCLETGGEGSAAELGQAGVEVSRPPPPSRLRLRLILPGRTP